MDKTTLEKRIDEKAEKHFKQDHKNLYDLLDKNPISSKLRIKIGERSMGLADFIFKENRQLGNYEEVEKKLNEQYREEEMDKVMEKLSNIEYLFNS